MMWRHSRVKHGPDVPEFFINVSGTFHIDAMLRQITEAVMISKVRANDLINFL